MHGKLNGRAIRKGVSFGQNALLLLIGAFAYILAGALREHGIEQRWGTAILGTLIPFGLVIYLSRKRQLRWAFCVSLAICLFLHSIAMFFVFRYVLTNFDRFSPLLWLPFMLIETVMLLIVVKRIEELLTGKREKIKLSF